MSAGYLVFSIINSIFLVLIGLICLLPMINVFSISFSGSGPSGAGKVLFWPIDFTLDAYKFIFRNSAFAKAFLLTIERAVIGTVVSFSVTILGAYALSKSWKYFKQRNIYMWFLFITTIFAGGMIPSYILIVDLGLHNTIWALTLPGALNVFHIILVMNFFKRLPTELEEAALADGASHWRILFQIFIPISKAVLATIILFGLVGHWNEWFHGMIYMRTGNQPLQTYLRSILLSDRLVGELTGNYDDMMLFNEVNTENFKAAQVFVAAFPIICVYPFLQKHFAKGVIVGSVKG